MKTLLVIVLAIGFLFGVATVTHAQNSPVPTVSTRAACTLPAATGLAEALTVSEASAQARWESAVRRSWCLQFPRSLTVVVYETLAQRYVDWEGDEFFIVRVGNGEPGTKSYTFAWPGLNSTLVQTQAL